MSVGRIAPQGGRDNTIRRTARILDLVQQIASQPRRWSRHELAAQHEVSERMIQKDLELIRYRLGLPLGHDGAAYYFEYLPQLPAATYSFSEAVALLMAARAAQVLPGINSAELAAAIARLESLFPAALHALMRETTHHLPEQALRPHRQTMLTVLHRALVERRRLQVLYETGSRAGQKSRRVMEPYHIMPYGRSWHLIAYDHQREEVLQFKVDRIQEAALLSDTYDIPPDFHLDEYLGDAWGLMRGSAVEAEEVILLFASQAGRWVAEEVWHSSQQSEQLPDGRVRLCFHVGITPEMVRWLLYYGPDVYVEAPAWLRAEVRQQHLLATDYPEAEDAA